MKAKIVSIIAVILFSSTSIFAQDVVTYSNINKTESGCVKEYIVYNKDSSAPIKKNVYVEDATGKKISKETYKWEKNNWIGVQKVDYKFNEEKQTEVLVYFKWNAKTNDWSDKAEFFSYRYDDNGELLASVQVSISDVSNLMSVAQ